MTHGKLTLSSPLSDMGLPDVVTSNTPPPTPLHDAYFFAAEEPCPAHAQPHAPLQDTHSPATPTTPSTPLDLPPPRKEQERGAPSEAEGTGVEWAQAGRELQEVADTFHSEHRAVSRVVLSSVVSDELLW